MQQHPIQTYEPAPLRNAVTMAEGPADPRTQGIGPLLAGLRRRWRIVLAVWLALAPIGAAGVLLRVKPTYTATAQVEVAPIVPAILYDDKQPMPLFESYLNTQTQVMLSQQVLTDALGDPIVKDLPLLKTPNPMAELRRGMSVKTLPRTNLIEVGVRQDDPESAVQLTKAVQKAYLVRAQGADQEQGKATRKVLENERNRLRQQLDQQSRDIRQLAEAYGTSSDTTFEILRETHEKYALETKQELERADLEIIQLEQQIKQLEGASASTTQVGIASAPATQVDGSSAATTRPNGVSVATMPDEWYAQRQQAIDTDPGVRLMRQEIEREVERMTRLRAVLGTDHKDVAAARQKVDRLQADMQQERRRAGEDVDKEFALRQQERFEQTKLRLRETLAMAQHRRQVLKERVDKRDAEGMSIGRQGLEIQGLREQRELTKQDYERVIERLRQMEIESQRPGRISLSSSPEVRPEGIVDKRMKMTAAAVMGSLCFAIFVALVRDRLDPQLHNVQQVEGDMGLRLLGVVPAAADVQAGRVTREHYLESFRVIRANLAGTRNGTSLPRSILVTSAQAGEGKTSLAVSLAISMTESGRRVLLVDGDIQVPQIGRLLKLAPPHDLKGVLTGKRSLEGSVTESGVAGLHVLIGHCNGDSARGALNVQSAAELVKSAREHYDFVIIDSPPSLGAADALFWAQAADGVIVASLVGRSDRKAVKLACQRLTSVGGRLLGSVIANVPVTESYYSYSVTSYRSQSHDATSQEPSIKRTPPLVYLPSDALGEDENHG